MELYIENSSIGAVKKAYYQVSENIKKTVTRAVVINRGTFLKTAAYRFFWRKGVSELEYVIFHTASLGRAIALLNRNKRRIRLTVVVDKKLDERAKALLKKARYEVKVIDIADGGVNLDFYKTCKYLIYKCGEENTILDSDIMHLYKFYETEYQCKFSSCLGNKIYIDAKGDVFFCPWHTDKSKLGNIGDNKNYFEDECIRTVLHNAVAKRDKCKSECKYFEYCAGGCPLEDGCSGFPELFEKNSKYIDGLTESGADLSTYNYAVAKNVIKDIIYGE